MGVCILNAQLPPWGSALAQWALLPHGSLWVFFSLWHPWVPAHVVQVLPISQKQTSGVAKPVTVRVCSCVLGTSSGQPSKMYSQDRLQIHCDPARDKRTQKRACASFVHCHCV